MDNQSQHVLIIGYVWPEPDSSAAGRRMMQLISLFRDRGWDITFASASSKTEHMSDLQKEGIDTVEIEVNNSDFDTFIRKLEPTIVLFDRFVTEEQFGWRVAKQCPNALRVLDTEDLHCLRKARRKAVESGRRFKKENLLSEEIAKREIAGILRCDLSLIISEAEMDLLENVFGIDKDLLLYLPFLLDPIDANATGWPDFEERNHFVTIGNFRHAPNWDAVQYLEDEIWPQIRQQLPEAELHVYGAYPHTKAQALHQPDEGFYIEGRAEKAETVVKKARVLLAPLRFGAGLKGKLIEAMQCGTPSVTTGIGAEGISGKMEWPGAVADDPGDIASAAVELYTDKATWQRARQKGVQIINQRFDREKFGPALIERISNLQGALEQHRLKNFTGAMLMHHTMASTEYMSRWIEAKNTS